MATEPEGGDFMGHGLQAEGEGRKGPTPASPFKRLGMKNGLTL